MMKNSFYLLSVWLCLLAGCVTKIVPPPQIYTLSPEGIEERSRAAEVEESHLMIKLAPVRGTQTLSGTEILYSDAPYRLNSYAYSRWSDAPVRLLSTLLQVALEKNGRFGAVLPPASTADADLLLESMLADFSHHIHADGTSDGVVRIRFYLMDNVTKMLIATKEFVSSVPVSSCNARGAAVALNQAATNVAQELASWLAQSGRFKP